MEHALTQIAPESVVVRVETFSPLLDSADIGPEHWNRLIESIVSAAGDVITTHGTDTMTCRGAALSQALAGIARPVVLSGSTQPLGTGGDAEDKRLLALQVAMSGEPDAWLAFAGKVLPAGALVKQDAQRRDAFCTALQTPLEATYQRQSPTCHPNHHSWHADSSA